MAAASSFSTLFGGPKSISTPYDPILNGVENADCCSMFFIEKQKWI
jgi:hypothetical protein